MNALPTMARAGRARGSVLIIVLWVSFGLVSLALYFAASMGLELRAADNRVAGLQAEVALEGAARYVSNLLATVDEPGIVPELQPLECEEVPVGDARFWLLGRGDQPAADLPVFGLVDEAGKLNLNTVTREMLEMLPNMTPELAAAIIDWRDADSTPSEGGAEDETYLRLNPPYRCKNAPFESVEELRLVYGMTYELLYGEDANANGILDPNENDGDLSPPRDNRDGILDPGLIEYFTVYSREPTPGRTNVNDPQALAGLLQEFLGTDRANEILRNLAFAAGPNRPPGGGPGGAPPPAARDTNQFAFTSLIEFYLASSLTSDEFDRLYSWLTTTNGVVEGLINVHTASETVLACVPGIGPDGAASLVAHRLMNRDRYASLAWVVDVLGEEAALEAGPYLTARSFQFTADLCALGAHDRGYRRTRFVFDLSEGTPVIRHRQDLTHLGWALGTGVRGDIERARAAGLLATTGAQPVSRR